MALQVGELVAYLRGDDTHLQRALRRTERGLASVGKVAALTTLATSAVALTAAMGPASGAVLALPPALLVAGAAVGVLAVGLSGMGDAMAATGGDAEELEEAIDGLAPSAQGFVRSFAGFRQAFGPVRDAVQERLFQGLGSEIDRLATGSIPTLETGMVGVAGALNTAAKSATSTMSSGVFNGTLADVFSGTTRVTERWGRALGPLLQLLASLAVLGMPLVERFSEWAAGGIESAAAFLTTEAGAAKLAGMVERAGDVFSQLWTIATNLGVALGGVFGSASVSGAGLLDTVESLTERFATWAQSAEGQQGLQTLFDTLGDAVQNVLALLPLLTGALGTVVAVLGMLPPGAQTAVAGFLAFSMVGGGLISKLGALGGVVKGLGSTLGFLGKQLGKPDSAFRRLITTSAGLAARMVATTASMVANGAKMAASAVAAGLRVAATWTMMGLKALLAAGKMAAAWLIGLGPIGLIIAAVVGLVALIVIYWDEIVAVISTAWEWVKEATSAAWDAIKAGIAAAWAAIVGAVTGAIATVQAVISAVWNGIKAVTSAVWGAIRGAISAVWSGIVSAVTTAITTVRGFITGAWNTIKAVTSAVWNGIKSAISNVWNAIRSTVTSVVGRVRSAITGAWNTVKSATSNAWNSIRSSVTNMINKAWSTVKNIVARFRNVGRDIVQGIIRGVTGAAGQLVSKMKGLASSALDAAKGALGINSPSKVFASEIGRWIPPGVSAGIDSAQSQLDRELAAMVSVPPQPPGWDGAAAGASGIGSGSSGPAVHVEHWHATERVGADELGETLYGLVSARG